MPGMIDRLQERAQEERECYIPLYEDQEKEFGKGRRNRSFANSYRLLAVADYVKTGDPGVFRDLLRQALSYRLALYEAPEDAPERRFFDKELSELTYVMDSLAIGDWDFTLRMMAPFKDLTYKRMTPLMGYLHFFLSGFLFGPPSHFGSILEEAIAYWEKRLKSYVGYALGFKAIYEGDGDAFGEALTLTMKGHKRLCHPAGEWGDTVDEVIAIWPLGLANLARMKGVSFAFDHPLLPQDLIVPPCQNT